MRHLLTPPTAEEQERRRVQSALEDAAPWRGATMQQHQAALRECLRVADMQIAGSPIGARLRALQDPRTPEAEALWLRLVRAHRERR